jgi:hypothetical protein
VQAFYLTRPLMLHSCRQLSGTPGLSDHNSANAFTVQTIAVARGCASMGLTPGTTVMADAQRPPPWVGGGLCAVKVSS